MQDSDEQLEILRSIDLKLSALLAVTTNQYLRSSPDLADPRPRSIDQILNDAGLASREIGKLLGKTRQAVEAKLGKPAGS